MASINVCDLPTEAYQLNSDDLLIISKYNPSTSGYLSRNLRWGSITELFQGLNSWLDNIDDRVDMLENPLTPDPDSDYYTMYLYTNYYNSGMKLAYNWQLAEGPVEDTSLSRYYKYKWTITNMQKNLTFGDISIRGGFTESYYFGHQNNSSFANKIMIFALNSQWKEFSRIYKELDSYGLAHHLYSTNEIVEDNMIGYIAIRKKSDSSTTTTYTVTFKNGDTVLKTQTVNKGSSATAPTIDPTKEGYTFSGWDKDFSNVQSDLVVNAVWTENGKYSIIFKNSGGSVLESYSLPAGTTPSYSGNTSTLQPDNPDPYKENYTFTGWDTPITTVSGNKVYTATYSSTTKRVTVTFYTSPDKSSVYYTTTIDAGTVVEKNAPENVYQTGFTWRTLSGTSYGSPLTQNTEYSPSYIFDLSGNLTNGGGSETTVDSINPGVSFSRSLYNKGFSARCTILSGTVQHHSTTKDHNLVVKVRLQATGNLISQTIVSTSIREDLNFSVSGGSSYSMTHAGNAQFPDALFIDAIRSSECSVDWNVSASATVIIE